MDERNDTGGDTGGSGGPAAGRVAPRSRHHPYPTEVLQLEQAIVKHKTEIEAHARKQAEWREQDEVNVPGYAPFDKLHKDWQSFRDDYYRAFYRLSEEKQEEWTQRTNFLAERGNVLRLARQQVMPAKAKLTAALRAFNDEMKVLKLKSIDVEGRADDLANESLEQALNEFSAAERVINDTFPEVLVAASQVYRQFKGDNENPCNWFMSLLQMEKTKTRLADAERELKANKQKDLKRAEKIERIQLELAQLRERERILTAQILDSDEESVPGPQPPAVHTEQSAPAPQKGVVVVGIVHATTPKAPPVTAPVAAGDQGGKPGSAPNKAAKDILQALDAGNTTVAQRKMLIRLLSDAVSQLRDPTTGLATWDVSEAAFRRMLQKRPHTSEQLEAWVREAMDFMDDKAQAGGRTGPDGKAELVMSGVLRSCGNFNHGKFVKSVPPLSSIYIEGNVSRDDESDQTILKPGEECKAATYTVYCTYVGPQDSMPHGLRACGPPCPTLCTTLRRLLDGEENPQCGVGCGHWFHQISSNWFNAPVDTPHYAFRPDPMPSQPVWHEEIQKSLFFAIVRRLAYDVAPDVHSADKQALENMYDTARRRWKLLSALVQYPSIAKELAMEFASPELCEQAHVDATERLANLGIQWVPGYTPNFAGGWSRKDRHAQDKH